MGLYPTSPVETSLPSARRHAQHPACRVGSAATCVDCERRVRLWRGRWFSWQPTECPSKSERRPSRGLLKYKRERWLYFLTGLSRFCTE